MLDKFTAHAASGVLADKAVNRLAAFTAEFLGRERERAAGVRVLDGVARDILQNLLEMQRTAAQMRALYLCIVDYNGQTLERTVHLGDVVALVQQFDQVKRLVLEHDRTGFQLVHIQDAVDQIEQKTRGFLHLAAALGLLSHIVREMLRDSDHALNAVDRCADIVAHAAQEIRLGNVGAACLLGGREQLLLVLEFDLLLLVDLADNVQNVRHPAGFIAFFDDKSSQMPRTACGTVLLRDTFGVLQAFRQRGCVEEPLHHILMLIAHNGLAHFAEYLVRTAGLAGQAVHLTACGNLLVHAGDEIHAVNQPVNLADRADDLAVERGVCQRFL